MNSDWIISIRFSVLDLCGSIVSCINYRNNIKSDKSWIESLVACTLMQFGGTTLTGTSILMDIQP